MSFCKKCSTKNPGKYADDAIYSFDQVYLAAIDPEIAEARAEATLAKLKDGADWKTLGDPLSVPQGMEQAARSEVERQFGEQFAKGLASISEAPKGEWLGPIGSGFGIHLLRVREASAPTKPKLADVRQQIENDWRADTIEKREAKAYQALLDAYDIKIARP